MASSVVDLVADGVLAACGLGGLTTDWFAPSPLFAGLRLGGAVKDRHTVSTSVEIQRGKLWRADARAE
jgi:hypothetical protein